jgi:hypothetical protein
MIPINLDITAINKKSLVHDLFKIFIFNFCAHITSVIYFKEEFLNIKFLTILFAIELGFILFYIFAEPIIDKNIQ